ncbi:MAG TPA: signal peptidase I, partial [Candidatus Avimonas sp.]|nr:signal peptidase I [Candidatus Avimonas sp.]
RTDRKFFGYRAFVVLSDSMSATDFRAGDLVLAKVVDPTTLKEGDIISFISQNDANFGQTVTHKIRRRATDVYGNPGFITYGTTTGVDDEEIVTYPYVLGKYQWRIPRLGAFFQFLKTVPGYTTCILLPFLLLIVIQVTNSIRLFRRYKAEQMQELKAEREKIEAERAEAQKILAELAELKAKLGLDEAKSVETQ